MFAFGVVATLAVLLALREAGTIPDGDKPDWGAVAPERGRAGGAENAARYHRATTGS
jgi:hypothetical protein